MATTDTERYIRIMLLTVEGGTWMSKKIFLREVDKMPGTPTLSAFIQTKARDLQLKRRHHDITNCQYELLLPSSGGDVHVDNWDLSLLVKITMLFFRHSLTGQEVSDLNEILAIRNKAICHASQAAITDRDFFGLWTRLTKSIQRLAFGFNQETNQLTDDLIEKFLQGPLDLQSSVQKLSELCRNDEHMDQVLAALTRLERGSDQVARGVTSANAKLDDILKFLSSNNQDDGKCRAEIPILDSRVCIEGHKEEVVKLAEDILLKVLQSAINKTDNPEDDESVRNAVNLFLDDIEKTDAVVVSAERGSIVLNLQCLTLCALENILRVFRTNTTRYRLNGIERALSTICHEELKVELVLPEDTVDRIRKWIENQSYKRSLSMGIQCRSPDAVAQVLDYFHIGDSANRMNQLSEALSEVVQDKVKVKAYLDEQGFKDALSSSSQSPMPTITTTEEESKFPVRIDIPDAYPRIEHSVVKKTDTENASADSNVVLDDLSLDDIRNSMRNLTASQESISEPTDITTGWLKRDMKQEKTDEMEPFGQEQACSSAAENQLSQQSHDQGLRYYQESDKYSTGYYQCACMSCGKIWWEHAEDWAHVDTCVSCSLCIRRFEGGREWTVYNCRSCGTLFCGLARSYMEYSYACKGCGFCHHAEGAVPTYEDEPGDSAAVCKEDRMKTGPPSQVFTRCACVCGKVWWECNEDWNPVSMCDGCTMKTCHPVWLEYTCKCGAIFRGTPSHRYQCKSCGNNCDDLTAKKQETTSETEAL